MMPMKEVTCILSAIEQGDPHAAEPLLLAGYEGLKRGEADLPPRSRVHLTEALERLVEL